MLASPRVPGLPHAGDHATRLGSCHRRTMLGMAARPPGHGWCESLLCPPCGAPTTTRRSRAHSSCCLHVGHPVPVPAERHGRQAQGRGRAPAINPLWEDLTAWSWSHVSSAMFFPAPFEKKSRNDGVTRFRHVLLGTHPGKPGPGPAQRVRGTHTSQEAPRQAHSLGIVSRVNDWPSSYIFEPLRYMYYLGPTQVFW